MQEIIKLVELRSKVGPKSTVCFCVTENPTRQGLRVIICTLAAEANLFCGVELGWPHEVCSSSLALKLCCSACHTFDCDCSGCILTRAECKNTCLLCIVCTLKDHRHS